MKNKIILILFLISLAWILPLQAVAGSVAVSGFAWSDTIGWIKFNPAFGGVQLDDVTGLLSGYAWSRGATTDGGVGWIYFAPSGPYPAAPNYSACLDLPGPGQSCDGTGDYTVSGWARVVANGGGWDGWIKLRGTNYGVSLNTTPSPAEFQGFAWSDMVVGWISFNRSNCDPDKDGGTEGGANNPDFPNCPEGEGISDYKVTTGLVLNKPPLKPTTSESWSHCSIQQLSIPTFNWIYSDPNGDPQAAYQIKIYGETTLDETVNNQSTSYTPLSTWVSNNLNWNTTYTWQVRVQDNQGNWSPWSDLDSFPMPSHAYPFVDFDWDPKPPRINEITNFIDYSICYDADGWCDSWSWTFPLDWQFEPPSTSSSQNPSGKFTTTGDKDVTLTVRDGDNFSCSKTEATIRTAFPLPEWREIAPTSFINKLLAVVSNLF